MAVLTHEELTQMVTLLAGDLGLQRLRDRLVRFNGLVTRRGVKSAEILAQQLYTLTGGLRRQIPASFAIQGVWAEQINGKVGEDGQKELEELAGQINACLDEHDHVLPDRRDELSGLLDHYRQQLADAVGREWAQLDMLLKAVPEVADLLRAGSPPSPAVTDSAAPS